TSHNLTAYCYYLSRAVAPRCLFRREVGYAVRLDDLAVVGARTERHADGRGVGGEAVRRNLRPTDDALTEIAHEIVRGEAVALSGHVGDDRARRRCECDERVEVARHCFLRRFHALLLAPHVLPDFVHFDAASADADHHAVVQLGATTAHAKAEAHDR